LPVALVTTGVQFNCTSECPSERPDDVDGECLSPEMSAVKMKKKRQVALAYFDRCLFCRRLK